MPGSDTAVLELDEDTIRLDPGVALVNVVLSADPRTGIQPDTARIRAGDVVRFVTGDGVPHAVAFDRARLTPAAQRFLGRTGQLRGPPLVTTGANWVVSFEGAPPGSYPFTDLSHGFHGVVMVAAPPDAPR
ncbi:MAG TPA: hypothetical protein VF188_14945 [Longimicrobiales bacterium]